MNHTYFTVLVIAGSDSAGGAGVQADIKTCTARGVYAMTAITAVTAQNTLGVHSFEPVSPSLLRAQLDAVVDDVRPDAVKIGMLPDEDSIDVVADFIRSRSLERVVLDPVMVATSGDGLTSGDTCDALRRHLLPLSTVVTPNLEELGRLSGTPITAASDIVELGRSIMADCGCFSMLLKGGHATADACGNITDLYIDREGCTSSFTHPIIDSRNTHGTGCSLSSAIASSLALGLSPSEACSDAVTWLQRAIMGGADLRLGHGHGPVNHLVDFCDKGYKLKLL